MKGNVHLSISYKIREDSTNKNNIFSSDPVVNKLMRKVYNDNIGNNVWDIRKFYTE